MIRQQWSQRLEEHFLPPQEDVGDYMSCSVKELKLMTSVTYQSIHSAYTRTVEENDEDEDNGARVRVDYSDFDLIESVRAAGIKTVCLDEAHHLRAEWQRSLRGLFGGDSGGDVHRRADRNAALRQHPWRMEALQHGSCGEIDEEIAVPELVQQRTLCPHQDYIYFNYPTKEEIKRIREYRTRAKECAAAITAGEAFESALDGSRILTDYREKEEELAEHAKGYIAVLALAKERGAQIPRQLARLLVPGGRLPGAALPFAETAFQFIIDNPDVFSAGGGAGHPQGAVQRRLLS